jgi:hypothetical protein
MQSKFSFGITVPTFFSKGRLSCVRSPEFALLVVRHSGGSTVGGGIGDRVFESLGKHHFHAAAGLTIERDPGAALKRACPWQRGFVTATRRRQIGQRI